VSVILHLKTCRRPSHVTECRNKRRCQNHTLTVTMHYGGRVVLHKENLVVKVAHLLPTSRFFMSLTILDWVTTLLSKTCYSDGGIKWYNRWL